MNNLSIQIVRIGHKLNEINMSFAAKGEFVIDEAHQMIQIKVKQGLVTVYWDFIWLDGDWAIAKARKIEHDLAMMIQKARQSAMAVGEVA
jgi:hypothetical protein